MKQTKHHPTHVLLLAMLAISMLVCGNANATQVRGFADVSRDAWFYKDVTALSSEGIVNGYPDGLFRPQSPVTRGELAKLICSALSLDAQGNTGFASAKTFADITGSEWFAPYTDSLLNAGIIFAHEYSPDYFSAWTDGKSDLPSASFVQDLPATRNEVARYICRGLSLELIPYDSPYADTNDIYAVTLYYSIIMQGSISDGSRVFCGEKPLTRAECCAVISRVRSYLANSAAYKAEAPESFDKSTPELCASPESVYDFYLHISHMFSRNILTARFVYPTHLFGSEKLITIKNNYLTAFRDYCSAHPEKASLMSTTVSTSGSYGVGHLNVAITPSREYGATADTLERLRVQTLSRAKSLLKSIITPTMTNREKCDAIHDYIVSTCVYDTSEKFTYGSYLASGALIDGKAVCQGYSAAFNLMCELCGIKSIAVSDGVHMWNVAMIEGLPVVYDTTWDDPVPDIRGKAESKFKGIPLFDAPSLTGTHRAELFRFEYIF